MTLRRVLVLAVPATVAACAAPELPPEAQAVVASEVVDFVQAHAIAEGCADLALNEDAVARRTDEVLIELAAQGHNRAAVAAYLQAISGDALGAAAQAELRVKGVEVEDLRSPAADPALCALGERERDGDTPVGAFLTDG